MLKRILIFVAIAILIIAMVFGFYIIRGNGLSGEKNSSNDSEKEPLAKLVYTGTNETLSEALYNLDLQDGKLERPYIVHKILRRPDPMTAFSKEKLMFIGKDGKVNKERIFESKISKMDITLIHDGRYAKVKYDYGGMGDVWSIDYYDIDGNLVFRKERTDDDYILLPNAKTLIRIKHLYMDEIEHKIYFVDRRDKIISEYEINTEGNKYLYLRRISLSKDRKYFLFNLFYHDEKKLKSLSFKKDGSSHLPKGWQSKVVKSRLLLFDEKGNLIYKNQMDGYEIFGEALTNSGKVVFSRRDADPLKNYVQTIILDKNANELVVIDGYRGAVLSSEQKIMALKSDDNRTLMVVDKGDYAQSVTDISQLGISGTIRKINIYDEYIIISALIETAEGNWVNFYLIDVNKESVTGLFKKNNNIGIRTDMVVKGDQLIIYYSDKIVSPYIYIYDLK